MLRASSLSPVYKGIKGTISRLALINPNVVPLSISSNYNYKNQAASESLLYSTYGTSRDQIWKHSIHSSSEQDEFSELDLPHEGWRTHLNLITEKPCESLDLSHSSSEEDDFSELDFPPERPGTRLNLITEKRKESVADLPQEGQSRHLNLVTEKPKESVADLPQEGRSRHLNLINKKPRESLNLSPDSSEDDFSELNSPPERPGICPNLITEMPKESKKSKRQKKKKSKVKSSSLKKGSDSLAICFVAENHTGSRTEKSTDSSPIRINSNLVVVKEVTREVDLDQLGEAVSQFGEITSVKAGPNGSNCLYVDFKTLKSKERALASAGVIVNQKFHHIENLCLPEKITIRISNITSDTAEPAVHLACMQCGPVERLLRTSNTSVDVVFSAKDFPGGDDTIEKLNAVCADKKWSAEILREDEESSGNENNTDASQVNRDVGLELSNLLDEVEKQFQLKRILIDDLVKLHEAVLHLQNRPEY